ncbi:facilitated trehalose transporter Tret1 isoform X2 [Cephus cinctus]|nr:facilitated trehalose transporter Tret1 isoform X2 [Cephus cinctus]XP_015600568.1 facilitated trehalose transporter Tret1 isoform X2 [Cephus cinctus]XP_024943374.1 facilitated trehalose transporter Tret1 isoform X2 [Cephus cinctus]
MALMGTPVESGTAPPKKIQESELKLYLRQSLTALGPIMGTIAAGMTSGYSAVLLPQLKPDDGNGTSFSNGSFDGVQDIVVESTEQESWIAAAAALTMAPGCWISGILMERFGRKVSHLITSPIFLAGWVTVGLASDMTWLIVGRLLCGLCVGLHGPLGPVYVAETSHPHLRGILLAGISLAIAIGVLISHMLGTWLHWRVAAFVCGVFPVLCFIFCIFSKESPTWLLGKNKPRQAETAWIYLRGEHAVAEFESLKNKKIYGPSVDQKVKANDESNWWKVITSATFLKPLIILNVFFLTTQFSGVNAVAFYCVKMLKDVAGPENAYSATLVLDFIRVVFSVVACWLTRNYGRRILALVSGLGSSFALLALSVCLFWDIGKPYLPVALLILYTCVVSVGLVPLPWLLCGELFSASVRGLGSGLSSGFAFMCFFVVVKTVPAMFEELLAQGTFSVYGIIALLGTIFLYFYLPETKDKTLQEIEEAFTRKSKNINKEKKSGVV